MSSAVFETAVSAFKRPQTYAFDRTTIGIAFGMLAFPVLVVYVRKKKLIVTCSGPLVSSYVNNGEVYILFEEIFKSLLIANKTLLSFRPQNAIVAKSKTFYREFMLRMT
jgi:hypothetical protein